MVRSLSCTSVPTRQPSHVMGPSPLLIYWYSLSPPPSPDPQDVVLGHPMVREGVNNVLHDIIETGAEAATGHDGGQDLNRTRSMEEEDKGHDWRRRMHASLTPPVPLNPLPFPSTKVWLKLLSKARPLPP